MADGLKRAAAAAKATRLSDRQEYALFALADWDEPMTGGVLASEMSRKGRETSIAAAHQGANGLVLKGLAIKGYPEGSSLIRYEITNAGRDEARRRRGQR